MKKITRKELISMYCDFFESKGHKIIPSASLIPENDPTVLFTTAGMHPLVPFLLGTPHPAGKRLVDVQKCIRTSDIDSVGDSSHLTFFEMLGNWSLGDYFKDESIKFSWEFLTSEKYLNIEPSKLSFSVFEGDENAPRDEVSANAWKEVGVDEKNIYYLGKEYNWWELGSGEGPCGPDSEIFFDMGKEKCSSSCDPSCSCGKYLEIWNNVFMEFKQEKNKYIPLQNKNVDTGLGVERTVVVFNGLKEVYELDEFVHMREKIEELTNKKYEGDNIRPFRIIMDHMRTSVFILGDDLKISPTNTGSGYVLRRLIRRMIRYIKSFNIENSILEELAYVVINDFKSDYKELERNRAHIINELLKEEEKFNKTLKDGYKMFNKVTKNLTNKIDGENAFKLFDTFGFPLELTIELASEKGLEVDVNGFNENFKLHQEKSRTASIGEFKGGLADDSYESTKYHTLAHIVLSQLQEMFGKDIYQKGCNITPERVRMDFPLDHKMEEHEKEELTKRVNDIINLNIPVIKEEMSLEEARQSGAEGAFSDKYGDKVFVYTIGEYSKEICGGPHIENTSELGTFKILKEESISSGVRRIKAILE